MALLKQSFPQGFDRVSCELCDPMVNGMEMLNGVSWVSGVNGRLMPGADPLVAQNHVSHGER